MIKSNTYDCFVTCDWGILDLYCSDTSDKPEYSISTLLPVELKRATTAVSYAKKCIGNSVCNIVKDSNFASRPSIYLECVLARLLHALNEMQHHTTQHEPKACLPLP